jgi:hypothetical protein
MFLSPFEHMHVPFSSHVIAQVFVVVVRSLTLFFHIYNLASQYNKHNNNFA